jgi:3',5'-cyclic AMP phosphodiesterase CpdA
VKLYAISDLHLANAPNREALRELPPHPDDGLIVAGDVGESELHLYYALDVLAPRFKALYWVPGNHDLWTLHHDPYPLRGEAKYRRMVEICRGYGVRTPEDPYDPWPETYGGVSYLVAPAFVGYDYSFRPPAVAEDDAVEWAAQSGVMCSDEVLLHPDPHPTRQAWCRERVRYTERRLEAAAATGRRLVLVNHYPLRQDLFELRRIPRFSIWCGTTATEDWHRRFPVAAAVYGHVHIKGTHFRDGVRFEEVSLGYPRDWSRQHGVASYLRQILPEPEPGPWTTGQVRFH